MKAARPVRRRGPGKPTDRNIGKAPRSDPTSPTSDSTKYDAESRTKPSATEAARVTPSIGYAGSSHLLPNASATEARPASVASSTPATPTEVRTAWHAKETVRDIYTIDKPVLALRYTLQLADNLQDQSCPPEINKLGRTIARWTPQIANWHISKVTNGPTEALNNLIKRIRGFAKTWVWAVLVVGVVVMLRGVRGLRSCRCW